MRQATHLILKLHLLLFPFYSSPHLHVVVLASPLSPRPSPNNNEIENDDIEAIAAAAQKGEALRARLQSHVEAQVNKILSEKNSQKTQNNNNNNNNGGGVTQKLELKIDLPPDLAALVNNEGGAALKIHQFSRNSKEESNLEDVTVTLDSSSSTLKTNKASSSKKKDTLVDVAKVADIIKNAEEAAKKAKVAAQAEEVDSAASATLCDLGTYSETGFGKDGKKCEVCPKGLTTRKVGSLECEVVTEEDMLGMFFDLMNGHKKWSEHQRRGWKSDSVPACQWEGVSCDANGQINGMAFPEMLNFM